MQEVYKQTSEFIESDGEVFYRIADLQKMDEFFMTLVSSGDHWAFISSLGGITAGRGSPEQAIFPYQTVDKIYDSRGINGPVCGIAVGSGKDRRVWVPFADWTGLVWRVKRSLYRTALGNRIIFEESNEDLGLVWQASWACSHRYGLVRQTRILNQGAQARDITVVDGFLNLMAAGVSRQTQLELSCLTDAYKDSIHDPATGLTCHGLSSLLTDRAEPMEGLLASPVWSTGGSFTVSLARRSWETFLRDGSFEAVHRNRGGRCDYLTLRELKLAAGAAASWYLVADTARDHGGLSELRRFLAKPAAELAAALSEETSLISRELSAMTARADGDSVSRITMHAWHHRSNVLFNIMRGGLPAHDTEIDAEDFLAFVRQHNGDLFPEAQQKLGSAKRLALAELPKLLKGASARLASLGREYLPLTFSRRHGDPSRPWNNFNIRVRDAQGRPILDHQGNWRDIFQNWEALGLSYPGLLPGFVSNFLGAMTLDGFNPYRVGRFGIDWEKVEPDHPWSNIGYWNDHQVIYFLRLAELLEACQPGQLAAGLDEPRYTTALVPYKIASWDRMCRNPRDTIDFDAALDKQLDAQLKSYGTDCRLVRDKQGAVVHASLLEKLLTLALAKTGNLVPGGGIWMNTQRPEWNDANNALVGNGLSMVTTSYLRRFLAFFRKLVLASPGETHQLPAGLAALLDSQTAIMNGGMAALDSDSKRFAFVRDMTRALDRWHEGLYREWQAGAPVAVKRGAIIEWVDACLPLVDAMLKRARRTDGLYEAYLVMTMDADAGTLRLSSLAPMLEGQVAILSAGTLKPAEGLDLVDALFKSPLYRADQHSFMLQPWKELPDFWHKNVIPEDLLAKEAALASSVAAGSCRAIYRDAAGVLRFHADCINHAAIDGLLGDAPAGQAEAVHRVYEAVCHHQAFLGRSGTMYAYEGLGSIYWHMVAKLLLAVQEIHASIDSGDRALRERAEKLYREIRAGIGYQKTPELYGAFPWEPYSHTPRGRGAQQPGMTGQVKEEVITRLGEFGLGFADGRLVARGTELLEGEFLEKDSECSLAGRAIKVPAGAAACTVCGVPVLRHRLAPGKRPAFRVHWRDNSHTEHGDSLPEATSQGLFARDGKIAWIEVLAQ